MTMHSEIAHGLGVANDVHLTNDAHLASGINKPLPVIWMLVVPVMCMALLLLIQTDALDLAIADRLYIPGVGFWGKKNPFLELYLHDIAKQAVILIGIGHLLVFLASYCRPLPIERRRWLYVFLAMALATGVVMPIKRVTQVQCPWSLERYGGSEPYSSLTESRPAPVKKTGQCWPGGHASAGFSLIALFFGWYDRKPRLARIGLYSGVVVGVTFSIGRMLQGAHFLSHNVWSALIVWTICAGLYRIMLYPSQNHLAKREFGHVRR